MQENLISTKKLIKINSIDVAYLRILFKYNLHCMLQKKTENTKFTVSCPAKTMLNFKYIPKSCQI